MPDKDLLPPGVTRETTEVTPELATMFLNENRSNRNFTPRNLSRIVRAMQEDRWLYTGDPIRIDRDGGLIDGQHRLRGIEMVGKPQIMDVIMGLDPVTQDVIDSGASRKPGQQLTIHGWKKGQQVGAVVSLLLRWHTQTLLSGTYRPDNHEVVQFAERHRDRLTAAHTLATRVRLNLSTQPAVLGAHAFTALDLAESRPQQLTPEDVLAFYESLASGASLNTGDPILAFRNQQVRQQRDQLKQTPVEQLARLCRAWNAWRKGERLQRIIVPVEIAYEHLVLR